MGERGGRTVEFELRAPHLVGIGVLLLALVAVLVLWFRSGTPEARRARAERNRAAPAVEDVHRSATLFDREGQGGAERDSTRQVTPEAAATGGIEVDAGTVADRPSAERLRSRIAALGFTALVATDPSGRYRVVAGPFETREAAQSAAARIHASLGREAVVR